MFFVVSFCYSQKDVVKNEFALNKDRLYNRIEILQKISSTLNRLDEKYELNHPMKYSVTNENFYNFFIYDLVDTTNVVPNKEKILIEFVDNHVYHIASLNNYFKTSIILILLKGKIYFFEGLNCVKKVNDIDDVMSFIKNKRKLKYSEIIKRRILNYKNYDKSYIVDKVGEIPKCECQ